MPKKEETEEVREVWFGQEVFMFKLTVKKNVSSGVWVEPKEGIESGRGRRVLAYAL